jgi:hypothetical protein
MADLKDKLFKIFCENGVYSDTEKFIKEVTFDGEEFDQEIEMFVEDVETGNDYTQMVKRKILEAVWNEALLEKEQYAQARVLEFLSEISDLIYDNELKNSDDKLDNLAIYLTDKETELKKEVKQP